MPPPQPAKPRPRWPRTPQGQPPALASPSKELDTAPPARATSSWRTLVQTQTQTKTARRPTSTTLGQSPAPPRTSRSITGAPPTRRTRSNVFLSNNPNFAVGSDSCTGQALAPGQTCVVPAHLHRSGGVQPGYLVRRGGRCVRPNEQLPLHRSERAGILPPVSDVK